jgi:hypothetical protein
MYGEMSWMGWPVSLLLVLAILLAPAAITVPAMGSTGQSRDPVSWASSSIGLPTNGNFFGLTFADINKDGNLDIVAASQSNGVRVYTGDGAGNWSAVAVQPPNNGGSDVRVADLDNDGNMDIVAGTPGTGGTNTGMHIYKGNGAGSFTDITSGSGLPTSGEWRGFALSDVNKDGNIDIAATNGYSSNGGIRVFTGNGTGKFANNSTGLPTIGERDSSVVLADFNNDTNLDLAAGGGAGVDCYLGNGGSGGTMSWTLSSTGLPDNRFSGVNTCDFNNDGSMDIILGAYNAGGGVGVRAFKNVNKAASWVSASTGLNTSGDFIDVSPGDFDGDGNIDILTAGSYASYYGIRIFYGDGAGNWSHNNVTLTDQYVGNDVADFNKDGSSDFAMGSYSNRGIVAYRNLNVVIPVPVPRIGLNSPVGGPSWSGGSTRTISWEATNGTPPYNISLNYSTDGGFSYPNIIQSQIIQADNGTQGYDWVLPAIDSPTVKVRIGVTDARNQTASNASPQSLEIDSTAPTVSPVVPLDGAKNVSTGTTLWVRFSEGMNHSSVQGAISIAGPGSPAIVSPKWYGNDLVYNTSGLQLGQRYDVTVSISAMDDSEPGNPLAAERTFSFNTSLAPIPAVTLDGPQGGELWLSGSHQDILWTASGGTGALNVNLEYSTTGPTGSWVPIASNESNDGLYDWTVPNSPSADCYVRVTVSDGFTPPMNASDICDSPFTIKEGAVPLSVSVTSPNGGEAWRSGTLQNISWSSSGGNGQRTVTLQYSAGGTGGPWTNISTNESDDGLYQWLVPGTPSASCAVKATVTDSYSPPQKASDISNASFSIVAAPAPLSVSLTSPNGGENWTVGTRHNITWSASGGLAPLVISLEFSTSGRTGPWNHLASGLANNGSHGWLVPNATSTDCFVRVAVTDSDIPQVNGSDIGDGAFIISLNAIVVDTRAPDVRITSPAPGQKCKGTVLVSLNATDNVGVTRLEIFIDGVSLATLNPPNPTVQWNTTGFSNGPHVVTVRAWDAAGNVGNATPVNVTVDNRNAVSPTETGFLEKYGVILALMVVVVVVAVVVALMMRRRPGRPAPGQPPQGMAPSQQIPQSPGQTSYPQGQFAPPPPTQQPAGPAPPPQYGPPGGVAPPPSAQPAQPAPPLPPPPSPPFGP